MQRKLCVKLFSKIPRYSSTIPKDPTLPQPLFSSPFNSRSVSQYSTHSPSHLWGPNHVFVRTGHGVFSRPALRIFFTKGQTKFPVTTHTPTRNFHSFDSRYRGWRSVVRRLTPDGVLIGLVVINAAVFIIWRVAKTQFMVENFTISVNNFTSGRIHTMITSAFSHTDMWHLITNMVGLYFFGLSIGRSFGPEYLLKLYLSGAMVGSIFFLAYHAFVAPSSQGNYVTGLGASGAVNAIMLLDIFLFPTKTLYLDFIIPVPAILLGIFIIGKDFLRILEGDSRVSGSAHLGGATVAALAWAQQRKGRFPRF